MDDQDRWAPRREDEDEEILIPSRSRRSQRGKSSEGVKKAPLPLRIVAWLALLGLFFGIGYVVAGFGVQWLQKRRLIEQPDVANSSGEAKQIMQTSTGGGVTLRKNDYTVHCLGAQGLEERKKTVIPGVVEEDLRQVLEVALDALRTESGVTDQILVLHIFRAGDVLYLDVNNAFLAALKKLPKERGALFMTGLVKSVVESFPPTMQVQIMVNGKAAAAGSSPIDLTTPWALTPSS